MTTDRSESGKDRDKVSFLSGDYNGDGRTDLSFYDARSGTWWVGENYRDDAIGFKIQWKLYKQFTKIEKEMFAPGNDSLTGNDRFSGDFNGDGFSDFLIFHRDRGEWILGETDNGTITFRVFSKTPEYKDITRWLQGDFNGDGRTDIGFYSKTDGNFWIGEAMPDGFRYRVYSDIAGGPDPDRVLGKAPLPKDEVVIKDVKAAVAGAESTTVLSYQYDANFHADRGEKAFAGHFTQTASPELLFYNRKDNQFLLQGTVGDPALKYSIDLDADGVMILGNDRPGCYLNGRDGIIYYKNTSSFGIETHSFHVIHAPGTHFIDTEIASFGIGTATDFDIAKSIYLADTFVSGSNNKYILVLDDKADTPRFVLCAESANSLTNIALTIGGDISAGYFSVLRNRRSAYRFFSGVFSGGAAQVLFVDMTGPVHTWYRGTISGGTISFTCLSGTPAFHGEGFVEQYQAGENSLTYATANNGTVRFYKLAMVSGAINQSAYTPLAKGISFKGEFDHEGNPVVYDGADVKKAVLGSSCRLESLTAAAITTKRKDLVDAMYPFQWIQGDYNGDGKTDIGFFHMKERRWYFALTQGTVPDLISMVKNGIGGLYRITYENSTRFDNTDAEGIPRLPMNYKVCTALVVEDGLGGRVRTDYEYSGGYAFSSFINGEKETDYFGFRKFTSIDGVGRRNVSEYYNVPYDDFRMNRALAGAVKTSSFYGSDMVEYERTEHEYIINTITETEGQKPSFLLEPVKVRKYVKNVLTQTRESSIQLTAGRYEMTGKSEIITDHYTDAVHSPMSVSSYTRFVNIDATNEMRVDYKRGLPGTLYETTALYEYDDKGNVTKETARYTGSGLPAVSDKIIEYAYDGYGNSIRTTNSSGSPARVTEKNYDSLLHQFVVDLIDRCQLSI